MKILIVGAGIAGLAAARALVKRGFDPVIIEKAPASPIVGAGIALPANGVKALWQLGLADEVKRRAHRVREIIYTKPSGEILSQASLDKPPLNYAPFVALHRADLLTMLLGGIEDKIQFSTELVALEKTDQGMRVQFQRGDSDQFDLVIGADGLHSKVRQQTFNDPDLVDLGVTNWRCTLEFPATDIQPTYMLGTNTVFMAYPIRANEVYCYAQVVDPKAQYYHLPDPLAVFQTLFKDYGSIADHLIRKITDHKQLIPGRLLSVPQPYFYKDKVALIGDASSACSPMLQQGAASAFEDAIVLAAMLKHFDCPQALAHYENFRKQRVDWIINASDTPMKKLSSKPSWIKTLMRNLHIKKKGPLNVQGWEQLFQDDPLERLSGYLREYK